MKQTVRAGVPAAVKRRKRGRRRKKKGMKGFLVSGVLFILAACLLFSAPHLSETGAALAGSGSMLKVKQYAKEHGWSVSEYPEDLLELYRRHPESEKYVLEYPAKKDNPPADVISDVDLSDVPLFMQWDQRWGYGEYAGNLFGLSGCGPTCLSMAAVFLTGDTSMTPGWMGRFAEEHGYGVEGSGSAWTLFSEGAELLGLDVTQIPLDENRIIANLEVNNPIVAAMGPGDFTTTGHFIVLAGYEDGRLKINDPNSTENSEKLWDYEQIKGQIRNLWVLRKL